MRHGDTESTENKKYLRVLCVSVVFCGLVSLLLPSMSTGADPALPIPTPFYAPTPTPPTQAGHGADVYHIYCMSCHGDRGQGLTDEFRTRQYPPEDAHCWNSGCHGDRPYEDGFTLPKTVPALIGTNALQRFDTAENLYHFIQSAMPFNAPGSLSAEQYLQLTSFLSERNGVTRAGAALTSASLSAVSLRKSDLASPISPPAPMNRIAEGVAMAVAIAVILTSIRLRARYRSRRV